MSRANALSEIKREHEEAKKTARAYLRAVGVLGPGIRTDEYREREVRTIRCVTVQGRMGEGDFPNDPFAVGAALLGHRYLHQGYDSRSLDALLAWDRPHPAYREALTIIVGEMRRRNVDLPGPLRRWKQEHKRTKERWRSERTQNYRIALVIEAMAVGSNVLVVCGENERTLRQLQVDLRAVHEQLGGKSFGELCSGHASERLQDIERCHEIRNDYVLKIPNGIERTLEILNGMNARPWGASRPRQGLDRKRPSGDDKPAVVRGDGSSRDMDRYQGQEAFPQPLRNAQRRHRGPRPLLLDLQCSGRCSGGGEGEAGRELFREQECTN